MIEVKQLKFKFDAVFAEDISFRVEKGEIYFILCKEEVFRRHLFELMRAIHNRNLHQTAQAYILL